MYMINKTAPLIACALLLATGCTGPAKVDLDRTTDIDEASQRALQERLVAESRKLSALQRALQERVEERSIAPPPAPVAPRYNPLDAIRVTLVVEDTDARSILQAVARQAELSLALPDSLGNEPRYLTLELRDMPASKVLQVVLDKIDMSARVNDRLIEVYEHDNRVFHLGFLQTVSTASFNAGGDVFGASAMNDIGSSSNSGSGSSGITSSFKLDGRNTNTADPYDQIEAMLGVILGTAPGVTDPETSTRPHYTLNRNTGVLFVRARPSQLEAVEDLISRYKRVMQRQVLIEAQLIDVELSDKFRFGVNWSQLENDIAALYGAEAIGLGSIDSTLPNDGGLGRAITIPGTSIGGSGNPGLGLVAGNDSYSVAVNLLRTFGNVHVLSNPSLRVKNTQPALVSVGSNSSFLKEVSRTSLGTADNPESTWETKTGNVFDGVLLGVIPFIADDGTISLVINPMQTQVEPGSTDPVDIGNDQSISLPKVSFKGMTTSLNMRDGDLVILGGMISETGSRSKDGIPPFTEIPGVEYLFGGHGHSTTARELVIALRVTLL
ncbi:pilus (MSHA type) biogenesis protein MshL [Marichromatium bheemlicum]|uniref:Pilus (MSHA type) biogenesis protein MshL n=1 Tax=Marichromatium bheemlicum TaxID=365339 RepID=A0ABX1I5R1_9GAMM|nr:pilus (MSHA type) biogenesis protein MshL [Marichromatium bheemlicum]NKN32384.1 pilus (MSHA type) biogenesis protein MshL [Marichromatium bheemlicum]